MTCQKKDDVLADQAYSAYTRSGAACKKQAALLAGFLPNSKAPGKAIEKASENFDQAAKCRIVKDIRQNAIFIAS